MSRTRRTDTISLGDLVALAFDAAEAVVPDPRLATALATLTVRGALRERLGGRAVARVSFAA